jgi:hypothetical protein
LRASLPVEGLPFSVSGRSRLKLESANAFCLLSPLPVDLVVTVFREVLILGVGGDDLLGEGLAHVDIHLTHEVFLLLLDGLYVVGLLLPVYGHDVVGHLHDGLEQPLLEVSDSVHTATLLDLPGELVVQRQEDLRILRGVGEHLEGELAIPAILLVPFIDILVQNPVATGVPGGVKAASGVAVTV